MNRIPQVISIVQLENETEALLKNEVRHYLNDNRNNAYIYIKGTVILSLTKADSAFQVDLSSERILFPREVLSYLKLNSNCRIAFIEHELGIAIKRFELQKSEGECYSVVDKETETELHRIITANPLPKVTILGLKRKFSSAKFHYNPIPYIAESDLIGAFLCRECLGIAKESDRELRNSLVRKRIDAQQVDGSWNSSVIATSRMIRELVMLHESPKNASLIKAANWLLSKKDSPYNPGMFFLRDELVDEQRKVIESKQKGIRTERFRARKQGEISAAAKGLDTIHNPCGSRIMVPNAMALKALLLLGYEKNARVNSAIEFLLNQKWCECGYQHGNSIQDYRSQATVQQAVEEESRSIAAYEYGGVNSFAEFASMDLSKKGGIRLRRLSEDTVKYQKIYKLDMYLGQAPCSLITAWGLSTAKHKVMNRLLHNYLWTAAAAQNPEDGNFEYKYYSRYFYLDLFSLYESDVAKAAIMRSIPWILECQNSDGSWGDDKQRDAATLAVVKAIKSVEQYLPKGLKFGN